MAAANNNDPIPDDLRNLEHLNFKQKIGIWTVKFIVMKYLAIDLCLHWYPPFYKMTAAKMNVVDIFKML